MVVLAFFNTIQYKLRARQWATSLVQCSVTFTEVNYFPKVDELSEFKKNIKHIPWHFCPHKLAVAKELESIITNFF
jgi:hypothetical protein